MAALIAPFAVFGWWMTDNLWLAIFFGVIAYSCGSTTGTIGPPCLNEIVPNEVRGRISAIYLMLLGLMGITMGGTAIALVTDLVFQDTAKLRYSIIIVCAPAMTFAGLLALVTLRRFSNAVERRGAFFASA